MENKILNYHYIFNLKYKAHVFRFSSYFFSLKIKIIFLYHFQLSFRFFDNLLSLDYFTTHLKIMNSNNQLFIIFLVFLLKFMAINLFLLASLNVFFKINQKNFIFLFNSRISLFFDLII